MRLCSITLIVGLAASAAAQSAPPDNPDLARLYAEDQRDDHRAILVDEDGNAVPLDDLRARLGELPPQLADDVRRRIAVDSVLAAGGAQTADDFYHAAMVYQHGADTTSYRTAHELASRATALDPEHADARWLMAASWDRYLVDADRPQWYGTQYRCDEQGLRRSEPVEAGRVTDAERVAAGVQTLAEQRLLEGTPCGGTHHGNDDYDHE